MCEVAGPSQVADSGMLTSILDVVPHDLLLKKLKDLVINVELLKCIQEFFKKRPLRICLNVKITSGVPQGCIIGRFMLDNSMVYREIVSVKVSRMVH